MNKYTFFSDNGHGWLKVKKSELFDLGIAEKITAYSYQFGEYAYLEEDCDLTTFVNAIGRDTWQSIKDRIPLKMSEFSRVRTYARYSPTEYRKPKPGDYVSFVGNSAVFQIVDEKTCKDYRQNCCRIKENFKGDIKQ